MFEMNAYADRFARGDAFRCSRSILCTAFLSANGGVLGKARLIRCVVLILTDLGSVG
jgi:hypothetical protein